MQKDNFKLNFHDKLDNCCIFFDGEFRKYSYVLHIENLRLISEFFKTIKRKIDNK